MSHICHVKLQLGSPLRVDSLHLGLQLSTLTLDALDLGLELVDSLNIAGAFDLSVSIL